MSETSPATPAKPLLDFILWPASTRTFQLYVKPFLTPYYFTVAAVLGGITAVFAVVTVLLVLVAANFNLLGLIE